MSEQEQRKYPRLECNKSAQMDWSDRTYLGTVVNLSVVADGHMHICMRFDGTFPHADLDDECSLLLLDENDPYPYVYAAKVIRVSPNRIVLDILTMHLSL